MNRTIGLLLVVAVLAGGYYFYDQYAANRPEAIVEKFVAAVNEKDVKTVVGTMDPKYSMAMNGVSGLISSALGVDPRDLLDLLPVMFDFAKANGQEVDDLQVKILHMTKTQKDDEVTIVADLLVTQGSKQTNEKAEFKLRKFNAGWRIVNTP